MRKLLLIAREELVVNLGQPAFYLSLLLMVAIFVAAGVFPRLRDATASTPLGDVETVLSERDTIESPVGFVDHAGLIVEIPDEQSGLLAYGDETAAEAALTAGEIDRYYVIPAAYLDEGDVQLISNNPQLLNDSDRGFQEVLRRNVLLNTTSTPALTTRLADPFTIEWVHQPPPTFSFIPSELDRAELSTAALVAGLFIYMINTSGFLLLGALQRESEARIMEVLITSSSAVQFIGGKIVGLSLLSFLQVGVALTAGIIVYGGSPDGSGPAAIPLHILLLSLPYLLLGYLSFSSIMLGVTVLFPNLGESMQLQLLIRLIILSPLVGAIFILPNAQSSISVFLTLFPFSSPLLMPFRLFVDTVPAGQLLSSLALLSGWTGLLFYLSTRLFRANTLLTGRTPTPRALWRALIGY